MSIKINNKKGASKKSEIFSLHSQKRAQDKVLSVYWIMILIITAGGIFGMVYSFYHHPYDVRNVEAEILTNKIADCLSYEGEINSKIFSEGNFNQNFENEFLNECNLNLETSSDSAGEITEFYVETNFYGSENLESSVFSFEEGNVGLIAGCDIQEDKEFEKEVKCFEEEFFSFGPEVSEGNEKLYLIKIMSVVRKTDKNVK